MRYSAVISIVCIMGGCLSLLAPIVLHAQTFLDEPFVCGGVYDKDSRSARTLVSGRQEAGHYEVVWDGSGRGSGVDVLRVRAGDFIEAHKLLVIR